MIYTIIGQSGSGKTTLGKRLHNFLCTERRNWRRDVFLIDDDYIREIYENKDYTEKGIRKNVKDSQYLISFLHKQGCDVVLSIMSPYRDLRESCKDKLGENIQEIFLYTNQDRTTKQYKVPSFEHPESNFIELDTSKKSPERIFSKLITNLVKLEQV